MMSVSIVLRARSSSSAVGGAGAEGGQLLVDRLLELLGGVPRARGGLDLEHRAEHQRLLGRADVLRDLLLVDQLLVQAARAAAAQNLRGDVGVGVARLVDGRRDPRHGDARQLPRAPGSTWRRSAVIVGVVDGDRRHRRAALQRAEVLRHQRLRLRLVEVAHDGEAGVVRRVVLTEECVHVVELGRLNVFVRADHVAVVGMVLGSSSCTVASSAIPYGWFSTL